MAGVVVLGNRQAQASKTTCGCCNWLLQKSTSIRSPAACSLACHTWRLPPQTQSPCGGRQVWWAGCNPAGTHPSDNDTTCTHADTERTTRELSQHHATLALCLCCCRQTHVLLPFCYCCCGHAVVYCCLPTAAASSILAARHPHSNGALPTHSLSRSRRAGPPTHTLRMQTQTQTQTQSLTSTVPILLKAASTSSFVASNARLPMYSRFRPSPASAQPPPPAAASSRLTKLLLNQRMLLLLLVLLLPAARCCSHPALD